MAYFAELDDNNIVLRVLSVADAQEHRGEAFLANDLGLGGRWERTSYNTRGGIHYDPATNQPSDTQEKAFRKNYAGIGYTYDEARDAFIPPQPFASWTLDEDTCNWVAPVPYPEDGGIYMWDEDAVNWAAVPE